MIIIYLFRKMEEHIIYLQSMLEPIEEVDEPLTEEEEEPTGEEAVQPTAEEAVQPTVGKLIQHYCIAGSVVIFFLELKKLMK